MSELELRKRIRDWIVNRSKEEPVEFTDQVPILESGILSSLDIVELVLFLEDLRGGEEIPADDLDPASFLNVDAIYTTFFVGA